MSYCFQKGETVEEQLKELSDALKDGKPIYFQKYFSEEMFEYFLSNDVFVDDEWNAGMAETDYYFSVAMYQKMLKEKHFQDVSEEERQKLQSLFERRILKFMRKFETKEGIEQFEQELLEGSENGVIEDAILEWEVVGGKKVDNVRYYILENTKTGCVIENIPNSILNNYNQRKFKTNVNLINELLRISETIQQRQEVDIRNVSKNIITFLNDQNVFVLNEWNQQRARNDFMFLLKMKSKGFQPTQPQYTKANIIIKRTLVSYIKEHVNDDCLTI